MADEAWQVNDGGLVLFLGQAVALLKGSFDKEVAKVGVDDGERLICQVFAQAEDHLVFDVTVAVEIAVEVGDFGDRLIDVIGDFEEEEVFG